MRHRNLILGIVGSMGLGLATSASAAPLLSLNISIQDLTNTTIGVGANPGAAIEQPVAGVYNILQGTTFRVLITNSMTNPNMTDGNHVDGDTLDPLAPIPLGMQALSFNLESTGVSNAISPLNNGANRWAVVGATLAQRLMTPNTLASAAGVNLIDQGGDGDLDPSGVSYANTGAILNGWDNTVLGDPQALQNGIGAQINMFRGAYTADQLGLTGLSFTAVNATALIDPAAPDNSLAAEAIPLQNITLGNIVINVVPIPEPATAGLFTLASVGLLGIRRRRA